MAPVPFPFNVLGDYNGARPPQPPGPGQLIWDGAFLTTQDCEGVKKAPSQISYPPTHFPSTNIGNIAG